MKNKAQSSLQPMSSSQNVFCRPSASASPVNLLEIQDLGLYSRTNE